MDDEYSQLNATDESFWVGSFILYIVSFTLATIILFSLLYRSKNKHANPKAFQFTVLSVVCSLCIVCTGMIFGNDLLVHWEYDGEHQSFVSATDSIGMIFYDIGKIAFYCSFTFHLLNIFDAISTTRKYLIVWTIVACCILFALSIVYLVDDLSEVTLKEIGITSLHRIYLAMFVGHEGMPLAHYSAFAGGIFDVIYFIVLIYCYIKQLRKIASNEDNRHEVKGVVLLFMSCIAYWFTAFCIGSGSALSWVAVPIDIISDDICLYLMFEPQTEIYQFWCKSCDRCCFGWIYGSKGYGAISDVDEVGQDPHSEALL
eukprot:9157_1